MPAMDFCNTMEIPLAILWNFNLQLLVLLSYNKQPDYTYYDVPVSDDFLSIWQTDKWKKIRGRWNPDTTIWDEVIVIYIYDGVGIHIENERAVTFDNYALPIIQRRYTLYSIPNEVAVELLAYVWKNVSAKE